MQVKPTIAVITLITLFLLINPVNAVVVKVEEISNYKMTVDVDSGKVKCEITIKNLVNNPIVPGIGEIRLQKQEPMRFLIFPIPFTNTAKSVNISDLKSSVPVKVIYKENYTVIQYEIWRPIEPKETYTFTVEFKAEDLIDRGILFKSVTVPVGADVDIAHLELETTSSWHLTYTYPNTNSKWIAKIPADHIAFFIAEYSILPLPKLPIRGYILFWGTITALIVVLAILIRVKRME